ncbi:hypothetical protein HDU76_010157, partial [Blyttiomyces sp. JEL0837]
VSAAANNAPSSSINTIPTLTIQQSNPLSRDEIDGFISSSNSNSNGIYSAPPVSTNNAATARENPPPTPDYDSDYEYQYQNTGNDHVDDETLARRIAQMDEDEAFARRIAAGETVPSSSSANTDQHDSDRRLAEMVASGLDIQDQRPQGNELGRSYSYAVPAGAPRRSRAEDDAALARRIAMEQAVVSGDKRLRGVNGNLEGDRELARRLAMEDSTTGGASEGDAELARRLQQEVDDEEFARRLAGEGGSSSLPPPLPARPRSSSYGDVSTGNALLTPGALLLAPGDPVPEGYVITSSVVVGSRGDMTFLPVDGGTPMGSSRSLDRRTGGASGGGYQGAGLVSPVTRSLMVELDFKGECRGSVKEQLSGVVFFGIALYGMQLPPSAKRSWTSEEGWELHLHRGGRVGQLVYVLRKPALWNACTISDPLNPTIKT